GRNGKHRRGHDDNRRRVGDIPVTATGAVRTAAVSAIIRSGERRTYPHTQASAQSTPAPAATPAASPSASPSTPPAAPLHVDSVIGCCSLNRRATTDDRSRQGLGCGAEAQHSSDAENQQTFCVQHVRYSSVLLPNTWSAGMGADLAAKLRPLNDVIFWSVPLGAIGHSPRALRALGRSAVAPSLRFIDSPPENGRCHRARLLSRNLIWSSIGPKANGGVDAVPAPRHRPRFSCRPLALTEPAPRKPAGTTKQGGRGAEPQTGFEQGSAIRALIC